jgi:hypothetical protein
MIAYSVWLERTILQPDGYSRFPKNPAPAFAGTGLFGEKRLLPAAFGLPVQLGKLYLQNSLPGVALSKVSLRKYS